MDSVQISVLICTYNRKNLLERALTAYKNQTFRNFEVIVASDGASDGTDEMILSFYENLKEYSLHYIRQTDIGFRKTIALNKAIRLAKGKILVFTDDDMVPPPHYLENYDKVFRTAANADKLLVYSKYIVVDSSDPLFSLNNIRNGSYMKKNGLVERLHLFYWKLKYLLYIRRKNPRRPKLNGGNFAVSAAAIRAINGMDIDFFGWGYEDDDLRRRLLNYGTQQAEAVCSTWSFNLGHAPFDKTTAGRPELLKNVLFNKEMAYDQNRPVRCVNGLEETEKAEQLF